MLGLKGFAFYSLVFALYSLFFVPCCYLIQLELLGGVQYDLQFVFVQGDLHRDADAFVGVKFHGLFGEFATVAFKDDNHEDFLGELGADIEQADVVHGLGAVDRIAEGDGLADLVDNLFGRNGVLGAGLAGV